MELSLINSELFTDDNLTDAYLAPSIGIYPTC